VPGNADGQLEAIVPALEGLGYRVAAGIFSSAATGNTMRRERLFILAERDDIGRGSGPETSGLQTRPNARLECCGEGLGDATGGDCEGTWKSEISRRPARVRKSRGSGCKLARSCCTGPQGLVSGQRDAAGRQEPVRHAGLRGGTILPPAVVPGPDDAAGWRELLDRFPEYQPALSQEEAQSHLRRGIDALAFRTERLRATGNGVDPVAAAYARLSLGALLDAERASAGQPAVRAA
jgi:DNA (cytosine-5)-methyltransferase 1